MTELPDGEISNMRFRIEDPGEHHVVRVGENIPVDEMPNVNEPAGARRSWYQVRCVCQSVPW